MPPIAQPAVEKGSLVLVIGASGFIGSNIADQFLEHGYRVRGTTRNPSKNAWLIALFDRKYGIGKFELISVPDMMAPGAFDQAVKGSAAVVNTATDYTMNPNPHEVIPGTIRGTINAMEAAAKESSVKRFVLTSSSTAALIPKPNNPVTVTTKTWNDETVALAYRDPPYEPERGYPVYAASKTLSERESWNFMDKKKPGFVFNAVLPNINFGASLDAENQGHPSTSGMVAALFRGDSAPLSRLPAQYFVDVRDTALLHVAAVIHPSVKAERIFAFAEPVNVDTLLDILRSMYPDHSFPANCQEAKDLSEILPRKRAEELLRDMGKDGWTCLEESVRRNTEDLI